MLIFANPRKRRRTTEEDSGKIEKRGSLNRDFLIGLFVCLSFALVRNFLPKMIDLF